MSRIAVTLVPVSYRLDDDTPQFVGLGATSEEWARASPPSNARESASELLDSLLPYPAGVLRTGGVTFHCAGVVFDDERDVVDIVMTAGLPHPTTLANCVKVRGTWRTLLPSGHERPDAVSALIREWWWHAVSERAAALELLPRYWTTLQLRQVYEALWGTSSSADDAAFGKWAALKGHQTWGPAAIQALPDDDTARAEVREMIVGAIVGTIADKRIDQAEIDEAKQPIRELPTHTLTPIVSNELALTMGRATGINPAEDIASQVTTPWDRGVAAARIACQPVRRGPAPKWFKTIASRPAEIYLGKPYAARPQWVVDRIQPDQDRPRRRLPLP